MAIWNKITSYCKNNIWGLLGFFFNPVATLLYLGTMLSFYQTNIDFKLTIWGIIVIVIIGLVLLVKLNNRFKAMKHSLIRGLLLSIIPLLVWLGGFAIVYYMQVIGDNAMTYWLVCGIFFIASRFCYCMHEIKHSE